MKVFIKEYCRDVTVRIYGIDGEERTKDYFDKYFYNVNGVDIVNKKEREEYHSEAEYSIEKAEYFQFLAQHIEEIQNTIDIAALAIIDGRSEEEFIVDNACYLV